MTETFTWCPAPGAARTRHPRITETRYGDGYTSRASLGININDDTWAVTFPGDETLVRAIDTFLSDNAAPGFWWKPPQSAVTVGNVLVTCDEWTLTWSDRQSGRGPLLGSIAATFRRAYNTQLAVAAAAIQAAFTRKP